MSTPTLDIRNLTLGFKGYTGFTEVLHGISLSVAPGERVALVGESGSGKSVTARIVLGLLQELRSARISGSVLFEGRELDELSKRERHALRGKAMSMIFQDPTSSLNPVFRIGDQFHDVLRRADPSITRDAALERAAAILAEVSVRDADACSTRLRHSCRMAQSAGHDRHGACERPRHFSIADEPGTALAVTMQAQTLQLMRKLVEEHHTAVLFISHNLGVVREFADRVYVIYKGRIVEQRLHARISKARSSLPRALMAAVPRLTGGGIPDIEENSPISARRSKPMTRRAGHEQSILELDAVSKPSEPEPMRSTRRNRSRLPSTGASVCDRRRIRIGQEHGRQHYPRDLPACPEDPPRSAPLFPRAASWSIAAPFRVQQNPLSSLNPKRSISASLASGADVHNARRRKRTGRPGWRASRRSRASRRFCQTFADGPFRRPAAACGDRPERWPASPDRCSSTSRHRRSTCWCRRGAQLLSTSCCARTRDLPVFITHDLSVVRHVATRTPSTKGGGWSNWETRNPVSQPCPPRTRRPDRRGAGVVPREEAALRSSLAAGLGNDQNEPIAMTLPTPWRLPTTSCGPHSRPCAHSPNTPSA